jgi:phosphoserine phosphatase
MDVDSTLIQDEVIELLAAHAGRQAEVAAVTERAMRGELDFAESLHERVACLAGLPESVLGRGQWCRPADARGSHVVQDAAAAGVTLAVVSGGFLEVVGPLAAELGHPARAREPARGPRRRADRAGAG